MQYQYMRSVLRLRTESLLQAAPNLSWQVSVEGTLRDAAGQGEPHLQLAAASSAQSPQIVSLGFCRAFAESIAVICSA